MLEGDQRCPFADRNSDSHSTGDIGCRKYIAVAVADVSSDGCADGSQKKPLHVKQVNYVV